MSKPFMTGSYAYGTPTGESDIDLVVRMDWGVEVANLIEKSDVAPQYEQPDNASMALRFGKLNLIICYSDEAFETWKAGTQELIGMRPVTREIAVDVMARHRAAAVGYGG